MMKKCELCEQEFTRLATHVTRNHDMDFELYLIEHQFGGIRPKCACGCGNDAPFSKSQGMRILTYIHGHSAKIVGRLTEESKKRIGEKNSKNMIKHSQANPEIAKERANRMREFVTPEVRQRSAMTNSLNWKKPESEAKRRKQSNKAIELLELTKIGPQAPFKAQWMFNPFTQQEEYMHSSWETRFLNECVEKGIPITKKHELKIEYIDASGVQRMYVPDFISLDGNHIFEVKGLETDNDIRKYDAAN